jgi:hypothetical protein
MESTADTTIPPMGEFMSDVVAVAEKAAWVKEDLGNKLATFTGKAEHKGAEWTVVLCTYDIQGQKQMDGAATRGGLLVRLLPAVAEEALKYAVEGSKS